MMAIANKKNSSLDEPRCCQSTNILFLMFVDYQQN